jgi:hypothetical protein
MRSRARPAQHVSTPLFAASAKALFRFQSAGSLPSAVLPFPDARRRITRERVPTIGRAARERLRGIPTDLKSTDPGILGKRWRLSSRNDSGHLSCWLICYQNIRLPLEGA